MFKEKMKEDLKIKIIEELKKASDYLDISMKYAENDIIVYGSIFNKENPNDIDVFIQVDIDLDNSNPIYQVYDFEEYESMYYDGEINAKNAIKDYLHGYILGKDQPSYEGKKLDINVELFDFEEGQYNSYKEGNYQKINSFLYDMESLRIETQKRELKNSEELNIFNSEEAINKFNELALLQRDKPEMKMVKIQKYAGGGVISNMIEHIGDLSHRVSQKVYTSTGSIEQSLNDIMPKINNALRRFNSSLPILKEFDENIYNNFNYDKNHPNSKIKEKTLEEFKKRVVNDLKEYAKLHSELPVYNDVQKHTRDAAVCLGNLDIEGLKYNLESLDDIIKEEIFVKEASKYNPDYESNKIENFLKEKMIKSKTELNWSDKTNSERPYNFDNDNYILLNVKIEDVINNMDNDFKLDLNDSKGGENSIGSRLQRAKKHFESGEPMDYSEVGYNKHTGNIDFTNGRHRAVAAYQLGHDYIPMFVYKDSLEKFKEIVDTKTIKQEGNIMSNKLKTEILKVIERNKESIDLMIPESGLFSKNTYGIFEKSDREPTEYFQSDDWKNVIRESFLLSLKSKNDTVEEFKTLIDQHLEDDLAFFGQAELAQEIVKNKINLKSEYVKTKLALPEDSEMDIEDFKEEILGEMIDYIANKDKTKPENLYNNINVNLLVPLIDNPHYIEDTKFNYSKNHNALLLTEENIEIMNQLDITQNDIDRYYIQNTLSRVEDINEGLKEDGLLNYESLKENLTKNNMLFTKDFMQSIEREKSVFPYVLVNKNINELLKEDSDKINLKDGVLCLHNESKVTFLSKFEKDKEVRLQDIREQGFNLKEVPEKIYQNIYDSYNPKIKKGLKNN